MQTCNIILLWLTCRLLIYSQVSKSKIIKYNVLYVHVNCTFVSSMFPCWSLILPMAVIQSTSASTSFFIWKKSIMQEKFFSLTCVKFKLNIDVHNWMDGCYIVSQNVIIWGSVLNLKETKEIENQSTRRLKNFFLNFKCNFHQPATTVYVVFQFSLKFKFSLLFLWVWQCTNVG